MQVALRWLKALEHCVKVTSWTFFFTVNVLDMTVAALLFSLGDLWLDFLAEPGDFWPTCGSDSKSSLSFALRPGEGKFDARMRIILAYYMLEASGSSF